MQEPPPCRFSVAVRIRPKLNSACNRAQSNERYEKLACTALGDNSLRLWDGKPSKDSRTYQFSFDHVFTAEATQEDVYENAVVDAVDATLAGTNTTIMAYGQTGSGKTYTVLGNPSKQASASPASREGSPAASIESGEAGVLLRAVLDILNFGERVKARRHVVVGVSVLELYQDEVRDLLRTADTAAPLPISMAKDVVRVPGLTYAAIEKPEDVYDVYARAAAKRVQRATGANDTSSRSHAIFSIEVFQIPVTACPVAPSLDSLLAMRDAFLVASLDVSRRTSASGGGLLTHAGSEAPFFEAAANAIMGDKQYPVLHSKLTVADLAGSEKVRQSQVSGAGFDELRRINASLTALGNVVHNLYESAKHIPYRDSKLTMLLRDAFAAPSARVVLIANVSPTILTLDETLSSLFFADKIKAIKTASGKADGAQRELEASYLAAIQLHDALLADMHIFQAEHEQAPGALLRKAAASTPTRKALFDPTLHICTRDKRATAASVGNLCEALAHARRAETSEAREAAFAASQCESLRQQYIERHHRHREKAAAGIQQLEAERRQFHEANAPHWKALQQQLDALKAAGHQAATKRKAMEQMKANKVSEFAAVRQQQVQTTAALSELAGALQLSAKDTAAYDQLVASAELADEDWRAVTQLAERAVEAAEVRRDLVGVLCDNARTTPGQPPRPQLQTVETWLRHAVLAMAGNAVVQSMRRGAASHADPHAVPLRTMVNFSAAAKAPKYWTPEMQAQRRTRLEKRHTRSTLDDPRLLESILSFMDMGAALDKRGHDGRTKRRMFYVTQGEKEPYLRWEEARPTMQSFRERGKVPLRSVTRILLGQTSPTFVSFTAEHKAERFFSSFSVEYTDDHYRRRSAAPVAGPGSNSRTCYVDIMCDNMADMETWVLGLSCLSEVWPTFADTREPSALDDVPSPDLSAAEASAAAELSDGARRLCEEWHIPTAVCAEAQREISRRCATSSRGTVCVTPGELRGLTRLDIFRASALWGHFYSLRLVRPPTTPSLLCCVRVPDLAPTTLFRWRVERPEMPRRQSEAASSTSASVERHDEGAARVGADPQTGSAVC